MQDLNDQVTLLYNEMFIDTASVFLDMHETQVGLPVAPVGWTDSQRRSAVRARIQTGPWTKARRTGIIEQFIVATLGSAITFSSGGVAFNAAGLPFYSGESGDISTLYHVIETITNYYYKVLVKSTVTVDLPSLTRELLRSTPAGISFDIVSTLDIFMDLLGTLTFSGNEITDALRTTNAQGDGRAVESSVGIWQTATNRILNGGLETNIASISTAGAPTTLARDTTQHKFGTASLKIVTHAATGDGPYFGSATGLAMAAGTKIAGSVFLLGNAGGELVSLTLRINNTDATVTDVTIAQSPLTTGWNRFSLSNTVAVGKTGDSVSLWVIGRNASVITFFVDGVQVEIGPSYPTPYIHTDGAAVTRGAGRIRMPATTFDETTFWGAFRIRYGMASTDTFSDNPPMLFDWYDSGTNRIDFGLTSTPKWAVDRITGAGATNASSATQTFARGDLATVIFAMTPTAVKVSVNGTPFVITAGTQFIPSLAAAQADIGSLFGGNSSHLNGEIFWAAFGNGVLSDADAAAIYALGNVDPIFTDLPPAALLQSVLPMDTTAYKIPN
jgi:hypothetical protein